MNEFREVNSTELAHGLDAGVESDGKSRLGITRRFCIAHCVFWVILLSKIGKTSK